LDVNGTFSSALTSGILLDIIDLSGNVSTNTADILTNTNSISSNTADILTNTNSISSNTADILTNTNSISSNVTNILTHTTDISSNTADILTNTNSISSNTTNIATNTTNIATNTTNIATNTTNIATNTENISTNTANISTNTTNITDISNNHVTLDSSQSIGGDKQFNDIVTFQNDVVGLIPLHIGLEDVDNTSDINKPVSTATQNAIDAIDNNLIHRTGDENITGTKTFISNIIVGTGTGAESLADGRAYFTDVITVKGVTPVLWCLMNLFGTNF
jgi:hypothetical protein